MKTEAELVRLAALAVGGTCADTAPRACAPTMRQVMLGMFEEPAAIGRGFYLTPEDKALLVEDLDLVFDAPMALEDVDIEVMSRAGNVSSLALPRTKVSDIVGANPRVQSMRLSFLGVHLAPGSTLVVHVVGAASPHLQSVLVRGLF